MPRFPYLAALICITLMLVVFSLGDPALSPAVLSVAMIGTACLLIAFGRPFHLLRALGYPILAEE